jgi:membrane fusion protein, multidrug efflux system
VVVEGFQKFAAGDKVRPLAWREIDAAAAQSDSQQTAHAKQ